VVRSLRERTTDSLSRTANALLFPVWALPTPLGTRYPERSPMGKGSSGLPMVHWRFSFRELGTGFRHSPACQIPWRPSYLSISPYSVVHFPESLWTRPGTGLRSEWLVSPVGCT